MEFTWCTSCCITSVSRTSTTTKEGSNPVIQTKFRKIGSVEVGKFADLVIWEPAQFGAKPKLVLKGGMLTYGVMGDAGSSLPTPQPRIMRKLYGAYGQAVHQTNLTFVSQYAYDHGIKEEIGLNKIVLPVKNTRNLTSVI